MSRGSIRCTCPKIGKLNRGGSMDIKSVFFDLISPRFALTTYAIPLIVIFAVIGISNSFTLIGVFHYLGVIVVTYALVAKYCLDFSPRLSSQLFVSDLLYNPNYSAIRVTSLLVLTQGLFMDFLFRQLGYGESSLYLETRNTGLMLEAVVYLASVVTTFVFALFLIPAMLLSSLNIREGRVLAISLSGVWCYAKELLGRRGEWVSFMALVVAFSAYFLGFVAGYTLFCLVALPLTIFMISVAIVVIGENAGIKKFKEGVLSKTLSTADQT